jgi:ribosomal-protein-serine acetyltransferase
MNTVFSIHVDDDLEIRLRQQNEIDEIYELLQRNRSHLAKWLPGVRRIETKDGLKEIILKCQTSFAEGKDVVYGIYFRGRNVGAIGYSLKNDKADIAYWISADYTGKGYASKSVQAFIRHIFRRPDISAVEIYAAVGNIQSRRLAERLGFKPNGTVPKREFYYNRLVRAARYTLTRKSQKPD